MFKPGADKLIKAYAITGIEPAPMIYYDSDAHCGCAAGVYAIANGAPENGIAMWLADNMNSPYLHGLIFGFDGYDAAFANREAEFSQDEDEFRHGYLVGLEVKEKMGV